MLQKHTDGNILGTAVVSTKDLVKLRKFYGVFKSASLLTLWNYLLATKVVSLNITIFILQNIDNTKHLSCYHLYNVLNTL